MRRTIFITKHLFRGPVVMVLSAMISANPAVSAPRPADPANAAVQPSYADLADQVTNAPLIIRARIDKVIMLEQERSPQLSPNMGRVYVTATVSALIRGQNGIAPSISYLVDVPLDARGKLPRLRKQQVLLFARPGDRSDQIQLLSRKSQIVATQDVEARVRAIAEEANKAGAPPAVTGVGDAFHVAGTVAGEGETQIFLRAEGNVPISLSVIRRPGEAPHWGVALGEVVDETAVPPARDTLLWYRLACFLPATLPAQSTRTLAVTDAEAARRDYNFVLEGLGTCDRRM